jgi:hypothetical protein
MAAPKQSNATVAMDSKSIFGRNGNFKSSVPPGAIRPKPVSVPPKEKSK